MRGGHPRPIQYPTILGHESVGRVIEVGKKVKNFHCGDLVTRVGAPSGSLGWPHIQLGRICGVWNRKGSLADGERWSRT